MTPIALTIAGSDPSGGGLHREPRQRHASLWPISGRSEARSCLFPNDGRLEQFPQLQIKAVASPGFGPIFGILLRSGIVFGIGGFEPGI